MNDNVGWDINKEVNKVSDTVLTGNIGSQAVTFLLNANLVTSNDLANLQIDFGYLYQRDNGMLEGLFKVILGNGKVFPVALQENKIKVLTIDQARYDETIKMMMDLHPCIRNNSNVETQAQTVRKQMNNNFLKGLNVATTELKPIYDDNNVVLKSIDEICKRAIACLIAIQMSCDIRNGKYAESRAFFFPILDKFGVIPALNPKELRIINNQCSEQDIIDMDWAYEAYWSLCWCLGLVNDISDASQLCDCNLAISFVMDAYKNPDKKNIFSKKTPFETFRDRCKLRSIREILDMQDLYFRYTWALNEKKVNPNTNVGNIDSSNVIERRRGLEWVISNEEDWYNVYLGA